MKYVWFMPLRESIPFTSCIRTGEECADDVKIVEQSQEQIDLENHVIEFLITKTVVVKAEVGKITELLRQCVAMGSNTTKYFCRNRWTGG